MDHPNVYSIILVVVVSIILTVFGATSVMAENTLPVTPLEEKSFQKQEVFDAVIEAVHQSTVSSRIAAEVIELHYDVNDVVPKGAVIMKFRDEEFQARVAQIKASMAADKAQVNEALARQKEAVSEANRVTNLFKRKLLAQAGLDKANADLSSANARVEAIQAQLKSRQAQLDEAYVQLSYTQISAPYSGVVTERFIELGEMASLGQHLMTGVSLEQLRVVVNVPQYILHAIQLANNPLFILPDGRKIEGGKITVIPHADVQSHSFKIRVDLPTNINNIFPGSFGKLHFITGDEKVNVIPQSAIVQRSEVSGVYVLMPDQKLIFRQVRLGRVMENGQREILAGLTVGEKVALDPLQAIRQLKKTHQDNSDE